MLDTVYAEILTTVSNPIGDITNLQTLFGWVANLILAVGVSLVVVMLALGFIQYITSHGDKAAIEKAQQWVTYAAIGGVGLFLVFAFKNVLGSLFESGGINTGDGTQIITNGADPSDSTDAETSDSTTPAD